MLAPDDAAPADEGPADDAQAPIDLVSDAESTGTSGDSDDSSDVAVVEPVDQAAAEVPCVADLLTSSDFTQHLLNDLHAPMVTVILEEQALAPARVLSRLPYLEQVSFSRGVRREGRAHADLATYLATVMVGLFDRARLEALAEALADYQKLGDPEVVARTLLAQINYTADVAANMKPHTHSTGSASSGSPGERARNPQRLSSGYALSTCTCLSLLPCLRSPADATQPPTLSAAAFLADAPSPLHYVHARWKLGLLGSLGSHPWLFEAAGQQDNHPRWFATGVAGSGVLGSPTLAVWRNALTGAESVLTISEVLKFPPWLFILLASRAAAHRKTNTDKGRRLRYHTRASSTGQGVCAAHHHRRVSVASGQPAPRRCCAPVVDTLGHWSPAGSSATNGQHPCRQCKHPNSNRRPHPAGTTRLQALQLGSGGGCSRSPRVRTCNESALKAGLQFLVASGFRPTYHSPEIWEWSRAEGEAARLTRCCRCA